VADDPADGERLQAFIRRIDQLIRLHPDVEELELRGRRPFASRTDRQIVAYASSEGWMC